MQPGPTELMVSTAWDDIQARFTELALVRDIPAPHYAFGVADWFSRLKYPALFLTLDYVQQDTSSMQGEWLVVALDLVLVQQSAKPDRLQEQMIRYTDSMLQLIRDDHTFGGACTIGEFVASDLYSASGNDGDLAVAMISIRLRKEVQI